MKNFDLVKKEISEAADRNAAYILEKAEDILKTPELGYKEFRTSEYVRREFNSFGALEKAQVAYTGVRGSIGDSSPDALNICVMGELDAVVCPTHPFADKTTGAAHACGHNGQIAVMLGVMRILRECGLDRIRGVRFTFLAVPAEEMIDIDYRRSLIAEGKIKYLSGKQQLIYEREFDNCDICMMIHSQPGEETAASYIGGSSLGFVMKTITFKGKAAHAGAAPYEGINALNAAMLSMMNMHAARETFRDEDKVRIHPIIVKGGDAANIVPDNVIMENTVRAYNMSALADADEKATLAVLGACIATRASATVVSTPGYLPLRQDKLLSERFYELSKQFIPQSSLYMGRDMIGSSDIGDVGHLIPTIQPTMGGVTGSAHTNTFCLSDKTASLIIPAKILAQLCAELVYDDCRLAARVKSEFVPVYTREEYIAYLDGLFYTKKLNIPQVTIKDI